MARDDETRRVVATNRKAVAKFNIDETFEAGIALTGPEVKSLREGGVNLQEGFVRVENGEALLWNVHISPYAHGSLHVEQKPTRTRRLLLHSHEIKRLMGRTTIKGLTIVPLEIYFTKRNKAKVKIGIGHAKKGPNRRDELRRRDIDRELRRDFAGKYK